MMQLHHNPWWPPFGGPLLTFADACDRWSARQARLGLLAQANLARLAAGAPPFAPGELPDGPATPHAVVADLPLARLLHYPAEGTVRPVPLVIVASLINRFYVLDLLPELSVIRGLCGRGFDVFVLDWKAPGPQGPRLRFTDYVDGAIDQAMAHAAAAAGSPRASLLGYCMGGTMTAIYAARHPERLASLVLLGAPIDFHASGRLADWTAPGRFDADLLMDALGNMPPALLQSGFKLLRPLDAVAKMVRMHHEKDEARLRHLVALESWLDDNVAFPGGVYREYIRELYQGNRLIHGTLTLGDTPVDLGRLTAPLLNVIALRDHICAPPSSRALMDRVGSKSRQLLEFDTGHIGLSASRRSHEELWPKIATWLKEHAVVSK